MKAYRPILFQKGMSNVKMTIYTAIAVSLFGIYANRPSLIRHSDIRIQTTCGNGKKVVKALLQFKEKYGSFPDQTTAVALARNMTSGLDLDGDSSNDYFRQLIAAGLVENEEIFYAATQYCHRGDGNMNGVNALEAGEVGFGYIMNGYKAIDDDNPKRIIIVAPLLDCNTHDDFDQRAMRGKAALFCCDGSEKIVSISSDKKVRLQTFGRSMLDAGEGTIWGTEIKPVIKAPRIKK